MKTLLARLAPVLAVATAAAAFPALAASAPDPVARAAEDGALWVPPPHPPLLGGALDPLLTVVDFAAKTRFWLLPVMIFLPILAWAILAARRMAQGRPPRFNAGWIVLLVGFAVLNLIFGTGWTTNLIYWAGESGSATITGSHSTGIQYNDHDVRGHTVLIRTATGKVVETGFDDDDFNVYPPHNATTYPGEGDVFTVRYLANAPKRFVIVADDNSPWARGLRCDRLLSRLSEARSKAEFAPDARYNAALAAAQTAARDARCEGAD